MKKVIFILVGIVFFGLSVVNFSSCKPEEEIPEDTTKTVLNEQTVEDANYTTDVFIDVVADVLVSADENDTKEKSYSTTCATITYEPTVGYPKTLTIDYGTTGCDINGHLLTGTITATISDRIRKEDTEIAISFTDFKVDTLEVNGTMSLIINSVDVITDNKIDFTTTLTGCSLSMPSGDISIAGTMDITWNLNTLSDYNDDTFDITSGNLTGTNRRGKSFTATVLSTLTYTVECSTIVSGELQMQTSDVNYPATIDFGNGTCDKIATVSTTIEIQVGNQTFTQNYSYEITLP
ncbi:MAG: hypothetical protein JXL97_14095 [Bacteroidales bacterium]|nr:hypothetical protein [Bacteroidales bacterium]